LIDVSTVVSTINPIKNEGEIAMTQITLWGSIEKDGTIVSGSGGFSVKRESTGNYSILFKNQFTNNPAMTGAQWGYGSGESTLDNVIFPSLSGGGATVQTGDGGGHYTDRNFSFIAIGNIA